MKNRGFTLVEILAVIVVLSLIMTIAVTNVGGLMSTSKDSIATKNEKSLKDAASLLAVELNDNLSEIFNCKTTSWLNAYCEKDENGIWKEVKLTTNDLKTNGYIDDLNNNCKSTGVITIKNIGNNDYEVTLEQNICKKD